MLTQPRLYAQCSSPFPLTLRLKCKVTKILSWAAICLYTDKFCSQTKVLSFEKFQVPISHVLVQNIIRGVGHGYCTYLVGIYAFEQLHRILIGPIPNPQIMQKLYKLLAQRNLLPLFSKLKQTNVQDTPYHTTLVL